MNTHRRKKNLHLLGMYDVYDCQTSLTQPFEFPLQSGRRERERLHLFEFVTSKNSQLVWISQRTSLRSIHSVNLSIWRSVHLPSTLCPSICLSEGLPVRPWARPSVSLSVIQLVSQSVSQSVRLPVCQSVSQTGRESVRQSASQWFSQSVSQSVSQSDRQTDRQTDRQSVCESVIKTGSLLFFFICSVCLIICLWYSEAHWRRMFSQSGHEERKNSLLSIPSCLGFFKLPVVHQPLDTEENPQF